MLQIQMLLQFIILTFFTISLSFHISFFFQFQSPCLTYHQRPPDFSIHSYTQLQYILCNRHPRHLVMVLTLFRRPPSHSLPLSLIATVPILSPLPFALPSQTSTNTNALALLPPSTPSTKHAPLETYPPPISPSPPQMTTL